MKAYGRKKYKINTTAKCKSCKQKTKRRGPTKPLFKEG